MFLPKITIEIFFFFVNWISVHIDRILMSGVCRSKLEISSLEKNSERSSF